MCDENKLLVLSTDEEDNITIKIDPWGIWENFSVDTRERIVQDAAYWHIIKQSLEWELGNGFSTPNFNSSAHKLREMIVTNVEFVNDITVAFIQQILEEWAKTEQKERKATQAFWKLYHQTRDIRHGARIKVEMPSDINHKDEYMRTSTKEVREEIMDKFRDLLKKGAESNE